MAYTLCLFVNWASLRTHVLAVDWRHEQSYNFLQILRDLAKQVRAVEPFWIVVVMILLMLARGLRVISVTVYFFLIWVSVVDCSWCENGTDWK